ncbi:hypothetical protein ACJX0J_005352, partial [Zea mays]
YMLRNGLIDWAIIEGIYNTAELVEQSPQERAKRYEGTAQAPHFAQPNTAVDLGTHLFISVVTKDILLIS